MKRFILAGLIGVSCLSVSAFAQENNQLRDKVNKKIAEEIVPDLIKKITAKVEQKNQKITETELELNSERQDDKSKVKIPRIPSLKSAEVKFSELNKEKGKLAGAFNILFDGSVLSQNEEAKDFSMNGHWDVYGEETSEGMVYQLNLSISLGYDFIKSSNKVGSILVETLGKMNLDDLDDDDKEFLPVVEKFANSLKNAKDKAKILASLKDALEEIRSMTIKETSDAQDWFSSAFNELARSVQVVLNDDMTGLQLTQENMIEKFPQYKDLFKAYTTKFLVGLYFASESHQDSEREIDFDEGFNFPVRVTFAPESDVAKFYLDETHDLLEGFANDEAGSYEDVVDVVSDYVDGGLDILTTTLLSLYDAN